MNAVNRCGHRCGGHTHGGNLTHQRFPLSCNNCSDWTSGGANVWGAENRTARDTCESAAHPNQKWCLAQDEDPREVVAWITAQLRDAFEGRCRARGEPCYRARDCLSGLCDPSAKTCAPSSSPWHPPTADVVRHCAGMPGLDDDDRSPLGRAIRAATDLGPGARLLNRNHLDAHWSRYVLHELKTYWNEERQTRGATSLFIAAPFSESPSSSPTGSPSLAPTFSPTDATLEPTLSTFLAGPDNATVRTLNRAAVECAAAAIVVSVSATAVAGAATSAITTAVASTAASSATVGPVLGAAGSGVASSTAAASSAVGSAAGGVATAPAVFSLLGVLQLLHQLGKLELLKGDGPASASKALNFSSSFAWANLQASSASGGLLRKAPWHDDSIFEDLGDLYYQCGVEERAAAGGAAEWGGVCDAHYWSGMPDLQLADGERRWVTDGVGTCCAREAAGAGHNPKQACCPYADAACCVDGTCCPKNFKCCNANVGSDGTLIPNRTASSGCGCCPKDLICGEEEYAGQCLIAVNRTATASSGASPAAAAAIASRRLTRRNASSGGEAARFRAVSLGNSLTPSLFLLDQLSGEERAFVANLWPVVILRSTFLDWAPCFSQLWPGFFIPAYCFAIP